MGTCTCSSKDQKEHFHHQEHSPSHYIQEAFYLHCPTKTLYKLTRDSIHHSPLNSPIKIREDSAIGYLSSGQIMTVGGIDSAGLPTNKAFLLDPSSLTVKWICSMPISAKGGSLLQYTNWVYYVGGMTEAEDEDDDTQEVSIPLLRYSLRGDQWEIFKSSRGGHLRNLVKTVITSEETQGNQDSFRGVEETFSIESLVNPGTVLVKDKIYFVGGKILSPLGKAKVSKKVYSLDLADDSLLFKEEPVRTPRKLVNPVCVAIDNEVFVVGGVNTKNTAKLLTSTYRLSFAGTMQFHNYQASPFPLQGTYPAVVAGDYCLFFSHPRFAVLQRSQINSGWKTYSFDKYEEVRERPLNLTNSQVRKQAIANEMSISAKIPSTELSRGPLIKASFSEQPVIETVGVKVISTVSSSSSEEIDIFRRREITKGHSKAKHFGKMNVKIPSELNLEELGVEDTYEEVTKKGHSTKAKGETAQMHNRKGRPHEEKLKKPVLRNPKAGKQRVPQRFGRNPQSSSDSSYIDFSKDEKCDSNGNLPLINAEPKRQRGVDDIEAPAGRVVIQLGGAENRVKDIPIKKSKKQKKRSHSKAKAEINNESVEIPAGRVLYKPPERHILSAREEREIPVKRQSVECESDEVEIPGGRRMLQLRGEIDIGQAPAEHELTTKTPSGNGKERKKAKRREPSNSSVEIPAGKIKLQNPNVRNKKKKRKHASSSSR